MWSFGIVIWEIFSLGQIPYPGMTNQEALTFVTSGNRLDAPQLCPSELAKVMKQCWKEQPQDRPSFSELVLQMKDFFKAHHSNMSNQESESKEGKEITGFYEIQKKSYDIIQ